MNRKNACVHAPSPPQDNECVNTHNYVNLSGIEDFPNRFNPQSSVRIKSSFSLPQNYRYKIRASTLHSLPSSQPCFPFCDKFYPLSPKTMNDYPQECNNSRLSQSSENRRQSSNASFSSFSSENFDCASDFSTSNPCEVNFKSTISNSISPNNFKNRISFWEEQVNPHLSTPSFSSGSTTFGKLSDTSFNLRMKRSSYQASSPPDTSYLSFASQDSNFNGSRIMNCDFNKISSKDIDIMNIKLSHSIKNPQIRNSQEGLYIANSMKEAKMHVPIDSLLQKIIDCFDSPVFEIINPDVIDPYSFFLSYKWAGLSPEVLACKLRLFFSYNLEYSDEGKLRPLAQLRPAIQVQKLKVAQAFRFWIRVFPEDFQPNSLILDVMHSLKEVMRREDQTQLLNLLELRYFDSYSLNKKLSLLQKTRIDEDFERMDLDSNTNPQSFEILKISSADLAKIIIWMEFSLFKNIPFTEFKQYTKSQNSNETQCINRCIKESNAIAMWIKSSILNEQAPDARALIIEKFIDVANEIRKLHAFQSLMSFVGSLNSGCICPLRLTLTWGLVPKEKIRMFNEFTSLLTMHNNYSVYRAELEHIKTQVRNFYFPVLGVLFKDLIQLDSKPNTIDTGEFVEVNEKKLLQIAKTVETWRKSQNSSLPKSPNFKQVDLVNAAIQLCSIIDEDELYKRSFHMEPNDNETSDIQLKENEIFSEFIKNFDNKDIEPAVIKLHVQAMTKAMFSSYDKDHNGYLNECEFALVQKNFPFIQNFNQLDKNKDGLIGQEEVYVFLLTSLGKIRDYFTHCFKEFHEIHPALCSHCRSMMWCPIEAACKCRDCDVICHKHCKDYLVVECKTKGIQTKKIKSQKHKHGKSRLLPSFTTDRIRHHSATELTGDNIILNDNDNTNAFDDETEISKLPDLTDQDNVEASSEVLPNATNEMFFGCIECDKNKSEITKLSEENKRLKSQLNTTLYALYKVKSDNLHLRKELEGVKSHFDSANNDLQTNNVELQRQFINVRNATGEFLLQQVALLNSSKSETYL